MQNPFTHTFGMKPSEYISSELIKYCYAKIWDELTERERQITKALVDLEADKKRVKREQVIAHLSGSAPITSSSFNTYRERLIGKGIISASNSRDGYYAIVLPQFGTFVRMYHGEDEFE